jgi:hydrogenase maturation protease
MQSAENVLVLGLGNRLLSDDAAGPLTIDRLASSARWGHEVQLRDGGTIGLSLLPEIEDVAALVAIDAARFGSSPGTVRVFEGAEMDAQLEGRKRSAHEVALADLIAAAALNGRLPALRALVAVEPGNTELGLDLSAEVADAIPELCSAVQALLQRWSHEPVTSGSIGRPCRSPQGPGRAARGGA